MAEAEAKESPLGALAKRVVRFLLGACLAWWWLLGLGGGAVLGAAVALSGPLSTPSYTARASLLYTALPVPEEHRDLYTSPKLKTLEALLRSDANIDRLREEFALEEVPRKLFKVLISTDNPAGTSLLHIGFDWADKGEGIALLDSLLTVYLEQLAAIRRQRLGGLRDDLEASLAALEGATLTTRESLRVFTRAHQISSLRDDETRVAQDLYDATALFAKAERNEANLESQIGHLDAYIEELKEREKQALDAAEELDAARETLADNRRRQTRLRELITETRRIMEVQAALENQRLELERRRELFERGDIPETEVDAIEATIRELEASIATTEEIDAWKAELARLDELVVPSQTQQTIGSPIIHQALFRRLELELGIIGAQKEVADLGQRVRNLGARREQIYALRSRHDSLRVRLDDLEQQRSGLRGRVDFLRQLLDLEVTELALLSPATPDAYPSSSNRKILLVAIAGGGFLPLFALVVLLQFWRRGLTTPAQLLGELEIPQLARLGPPGPEDEDARVLALRVRQAVPQPGAVLLLLGVGRATPLAGPAQRFASSLARRGERVVLADLRFGGADLGADTPDSVGACLLDGQAPALAPGPLPGLRLLPAGPAVPRDLLASPRMRALLEQLRAEASLVVLLGPGLDRQVDCELLAALAGGVVFGYGEEEKLAPGARPTLEALRRVKTPVAGAFASGC